MKRPFRTGLVAGLLALTLAGAACGSGSGSESPAKSEGAISAPTTQAAPQTPETSAPVAATAPAAATTATTAKAAAPKPAAAPKAAAPKVTTTTAAPAKKADPVNLRLAYFPNVTHAAAIAGVEKGIFADKLGPDVTLKTSTFNAGSAALEALFAGDLDITYIGPNPSINAYAQSGGEAARIIAGSTSGGAALVVRDGIDTVEDLRGTTLATPQLGNTQDVALRSFLADNDLSADTAGGGDVSIQPQANGDALAAFEAGQIDGAWVPEPFATRFQLEGGGHVLVDEADLWPDGQFVTTDVLVRTEFLAQHPDVVEAFLRGHLAAIAAIEADPAHARTVANDEIEAITTKRLSDEVLATAWARLTFTPDPIASSLQESAAHAEDLGLLDPADLSGIYALSILNGLLEADGRPTVAGL
jgi:NitT/TauT family transport system substrate-binding protein